MSHFTVLVIGQDVEGQLARYDENTRMPRYVEYTKEELIEKGKQKIKDYIVNVYSKFLSDPEKYEKNCSNPNHMKYLKEEFPKKTSWSDEEIYAEEIKWYEPEDIGDEGEVYSTYNPDSKWDWYQVGGRWSGFFKMKQGKSGELGEKSWYNEGKEIEEDRADQAKKGDIDWEGMLSDQFESYSKNYDEFEKLMKDNPEEARKRSWWDFGINNVSKDEDEFVPESRESYLKKAVPSTFAVVKGGEWYQKGDMGWWGMTSNEKEQDRWNEEFKKLIDEASDDTLLTVVDCHI